MHQTAGSTGPTTEEQPQGTRNGGQATADATRVEPEQQPDHANVSGGGDERAGTAGAWPMPYVMDTSGGADAEPDVSAIGARHNDGEATDRADAWREPDARTLPRTQSPAREEGRTEMPRGTPRQTPPAAGSQDGQQPPGAATDETGGQGGERPSREPPPRPPGRSRTAWAYCR